MAHEEEGPQGPDLRLGISLEELEDGRPVLGHVDGVAAVLVRHQDRIAAVGAACTHYGGPLAEGLVVADTIRCPWHHACFSLRTGAALAAPALDDLPFWNVEVKGGRAVVTERAAAGADTLAAARAPGTLAAARTPGTPGAGRAPGAVVIVGAGAAGTAAAQALRKEGYDGSVTLVDPDPDAPYDRPNLSKDYLAGSAPEEWLPLRPPEFFEDNRIARRIDAATRIVPEEGVVHLAGGEELAYEALLLATGAVPVRLPVPGADLPHVLVLRSLADCRRLIEHAGEASEAVIVGAGFIGMEAAASLRNRGLGVTVVAPEAVPLERVFGRELGGFVRGLQEEHGVRLRLGRTLSAVEGSGVVLDDGSRLPADLVLVAVGVRPDTALAESAGLEVHDGVIVDAGLASSIPGIWAAGDMARFPDARTGELVRVEHWVVAERQGQVAARNMLGAGVAFDDPPFFWTAMHGTRISYVGHASRWDEVLEEGDLQDGGSGVVRYLDHGQVAAVATVGRDMESLMAEAEMAARVGTRQA